MSEAHTTKLESRQKRRGVLRKKRTEWRAVATQIKDDNRHTFLFGWTTKTEASNMMVVLAAADRETLAAIATERAEAVVGADGRGYARGTSVVRAELERDHEREIAGLRFDYIGQIAAAKDKARAEQLAVNEHLLRTLEAQVTFNQAQAEWWAERFEIETTPDGALIPQADGTFRISGTRRHLVLAGLYWQMFEGDTKLASSRDIFEALNPPQDEAAAA